MHRLGHVVHIRGAESSCVTSGTHSVPLGYRVMRGTSWQEAHTVSLLPDWREARCPLEEEVEAGVLHCKASLPFGVSNQDVV